VNILVTGGAGFIGSHIVDMLIEAGHNVTIVDNLITGRRELANPRARLHVIDIRDAELGAVFDAARPDIVVHAAAQVSVSRSVADPVADASVNVVGTITLLEHCRRARVRRVVYISTGGAAYGDTDVIPTPETHPTRAMSPYGISKVAAERYVELWRDLTGAECVVLRLANVYGPRQNAEGEAGVVAIFIERVLAGRPCVVNGDGEQTRDFVFVGDVAAAVVRAVERPHAGGIFNISTGRETSVNELLNELRKIFDVSVVSEYGPPRSGEQRRSVLDPRHAANHLGYRPSASLIEGLRRTVDYARDRHGASS
jgi:UDP-glucose 4-epimerase